MPGFSDDSTGVGPAMGGPGNGLDEAAAAGVLFLTADPVVHDGRRVQVAGRSLLNFGSTSYLGLDRAPELATGAMEAVRRYGSQFPFPRAFVQCPLYVELEAALGRMCGGHAVVAPSTTLAHQAALPTLVEKGDAVILSRHAHPSLHMAVALLDDIAVELADEHDTNAVADRVRSLGRTSHRVWLLLDGLASADGRFAPFEDLEELQQRHSFLNLYVDEAHTTSWYGTHGRGRALEDLSDPTRVVAVLSLNKAFAAAGSAVILPNGALAQRLRRTGGPLVFSGPLPPPMLGAALASAELHSSGRLPDLQARLTARIQSALVAAQNAHVRLLDQTVSPLFFVPCGTPEAVFRIVSELASREVCVCPVIPPMVEPHASGIRFTISLHNQPEDITFLMTAMAELS